MEEQRETYRLVLDTEEFTECIRRLQNQVMNTIRSKKPVVSTVVKRIMKEQLPLNKVISIQTPR